MTDQTTATTETTETVVTNDYVAQLAKEQELADIETALGKPVTSSNHAMIWHSLRLANINDKIAGFGKLFTLPA